MVKQRLHHAASYLTLITVMFCGIVLTACSPVPGEDNSPTETPAPTPVVPVKPVYTVQRGEVVKDIEFSGSVQPIVSKELSFQVNGFLRQVNVVRGDAVKSGQVLAEMESSNLENQLAQARLELKSRETDLAAAQQAAADALAEAQIALAIEQLRLDEARYYLKTEGTQPRQYAVQIQEQNVKLAQLRVDKLQRGVDPQVLQGVEAASLTVQSLEAQLADTRLVSPMDGTVLSIQIRHAGDTITAYRPVITIGDTNQLEVVADLTSRADAAGLEKGMEAAIVRPGPASTPIKGTIRLVPGIVQTDGDPTTRVTLEGPAAGAGLSLDDSVRVTVVLDRRENVLWLPAQAVRTFEGRRFVIVQDSGGLRRVDVTIGLVGTENVEIIDGLTEGQIVQAP